MVVARMDVDVHASSTSNRGVLVQSDTKTSIALKFRFDPAFHFLLNAFVLTMN